MKGLLLSRFLLACLLTIGFAQSALGQTVASNARGVVTDESGNPIVNASVQITHVPTSSTRITTTSENGVYFQPGLRVGGPYSVRVSAPGFRTSQVDGISLKPGTQPVRDIVLDLVAEEIEEIVVTGQATVLRDLNNGVGSAYAAEDIINMPATNRDVLNTLLRDPLAQTDGDVGNFSVAGVNPRFNGLAIDGSLQQDDFGLGDSTYATARSPINLDAVESASVVAADYDVIASGFTGGLVNITIKSGTNEWDGAAYFDNQTDSMFGDTYEGGTFNPGPVDDEEYGFVVGGPLVRDRLFIFASYDEFKATNVEDWTVDDADDGIQPGFFDALGNIIQDNLGFNPGTRPVNATTPETSERALLKLDWNINDFHRASFTYQSTEETGTSVDQNEFESAWYDIPVDLKAYSGQVYSDWTSNLSTTLRLNLKEFERGQNCRAGAGIGHVEIENLDQDDVIGTPLEGLLTDDPGDIIAGCDRFRHANEFNDERLQFQAKADYFLGNHVITGGFEYEDFSLFNLFVQSSRGRFQFDGINGLLNGVADVSYINVPSNNAQDGAANWGYNRWTLFVQDSFQITPTFELKYGLRYETFAQSDKPAFSQSTLDTYGVRSDANLDGRDLILPRISFRWDVMDRATLTGGFGRFSGGDPKVWISNAFQQPTVFASANEVQVAGVSSVPQTLLDSVAAGTPLPIDVISDNFEIPSDWKASLRWEQEFDIPGFGRDYVWTAQYLLTRTEDGFLWRNLAQTQLGAAQPTGTAPDGRVIYADLQDLSINNLTQLGNHDEGESHVFTVGLAKQYDNGFNFNINYAYQDIEVVTEGTSSRGISNWRGITDVDRNFPGPKVSPFQVEHSFKANLGYQRDFFGTGQSSTRIDLFARRVSGDTFYYTFNTSNNNSLFGRAGQFEGPFDNNPLYVPNGPNDPRVVFDPGFDQAAFFNYVSVNGIPAGTNEPFSHSSGWNSIVDLRIAQEIPGLPFLGDFVGDNKFQVYLNIENVLNLLNDDWGRFVDGPRFGQNAIVSADLVSASDVAANGVANATALLGDEPRTTCTSANACVYRFNSFSDRDTEFTEAFDSVYRIRIGARFEF